MSPTEATHVPEPKKLKLVLVVGAVLALAAVAWGLAVRAHDYHALVKWTDAQEVPTVSLLRPVAGERGVTTLPGALQAWTDAPIHARVGGYVKRWNVDIGQTVKAGDVLAEIDTPELDQQESQARADVARARARAHLAGIGEKRWKDLLSSHSVSQQESDEKTGEAEAANADVQAAQAALDRIAALESFKTVIAPFGGTVTARNVDVGDLISADGGGSPMFRIADTAHMRLYVDVPQDLADAVTPGLAVTLTVPEHPEQTFKATLAGRSGAVNTQSGSQLVQFSVDNSKADLMPGDYAQVALPLKANAQLLSVPATALLFRAGGTQIAVLGAGNRVTMRNIHIASDQGTTLIIDEGLKSSDRVIDHPTDSLAAGDMVKVEGGSHAPAA